MIFQGIWTSIDKEPYSFVIFQGGGGGPDPLSLPLDPRMITAHAQKLSLNIHTEISKEARGLNSGLCLHQNPYTVYTR